MFEMLGIPLFLMHPSSHSRPSVLTKPTVEDEKTLAIDMQSLSPIFAAVRV